MVYKLPTDADGVKYHGVVDPDGDNPGQVLYGVDEHGNYRPVNVDSEGNVLTKVTGSNVEEEYDGEMVVKTRTMGLSWKSFNPFNSQTLLVPQGTYVDRTGDAMKVNGYSTLGLIVRDSVFLSRGKFYVSVYWTGHEGSLSTPLAVPERFNYDPQVNTDIGLSLSVPTKAEYVSFRIHNENGEDRTFYVKGLLRT